MAADGGRSSSESQQQTATASQSQQQQHSSFKYKPGSIKSIKLLNFMCHESFEVAFGPRVNFVIGPNGSGKSALLTALVIVLGGRATATSRGKKTNEFVKYGKDYARITLVIHNYCTIMEKDGAFKPDDYGKQIVIEKTIYKDDLAKLVLKNDKDKRVSERKQELDEMLEHFAIQINNPICILNQEVSKTFLHSKRPEDKFELFMKATNLEQIQHDYSFSKELHGVWKDCNQRKSVAFRMLDSEHSSCLEKISFIKNRLKLEERSEFLCLEANWAHVRDYEIACQRQSNILGNLPNNIVSIETEIENYNKNIKNSEELIESSKERAIECEEACNKTKKKIEDIRSKEMKVKTSRIDVKHKIDTEKNNLHRLKSQKINLEKKIEDLRRKFNEVDVTSVENDRRKLEIETLEREIPTYHARERSIQQHTSQLNQSMAETRSELHKAQMQLSELRNSISAKQAMLRRLRIGRENELQKYGDGSVRLVEEINLAYKNGRFKKKPIGPLGSYIKLKSPDVAPAFEQQIGKNAFAFTCDNIQDMQVLNDLIKKVKISNRDNFREPLIITRSFCSRHDAQRFKAKHHQYKTLYDYIDVEDDAAANALLDRCSLESVLFIPDYVEAENLMITPSLIPTHTRCAYTKDSCVMYPRTATGGYRCVNFPSNNLGLFSKGNEDQVRHIEHTIESMELEYRTHEANLARIKDSLSAQTAEYESNQRETRKITAEVRAKETQLLNLKTTMNNTIPPEISGYENELENCLSRIASSSKIIEELSNEIAKIESELSEIDDNKKAVLAIAQEHNKELNRVQTDVTKAKENIKEYHGAIASSKKKVVEIQKQIEEETAKLQRYEKDLEEALRQLVGTERPPEIRDTKVIKDEYDDIKRQLSVDLDMNANADETLSALRKRMIEIEEVKALRDHNQRNFELSGKTLSDRDDGFKSLRNNTVSQVSSVFSSMMKAMGMNGMLNIHLQDQFVRGELVHKGSTLEMHIDPAPQTQRPGGLSDSRSNLDAPSRRSRSQPAGPSGDPPRPKRARMAAAAAQEKENIQMTDTRSLSGGERSFSTVAFVLSLWHLCSSPFKLMDEIDVFMDMVTRRLSYSALIKFASKSEASGQFVFFSPLELPKIDDAEEGLVRVFEMPRIITEESAH